MQGVHNITGRIPIRTIQLYCFGSNDIDREDAIKKLLRKSSCIFRGNFNRITRKLTRFHRHRQSKEHQNKQHQSQSEFS